ncbi:MAG: DUF5011 domain-containing protein [Bacteroidetes bacterium]|nr:DUF5011 domain-containing protein [Bacteroidota bacterium]
MKTYILILSLVSILFLSCDPEEMKEEVIRPAIILNGNKMDTAYLYTTYIDPGAKFFEDNKNGWINDRDFIPVTDISGTVKTNLPGTCYLNYNAKDSSGKPLATVTRTVHVVENRTAFLNGNYDVTCTCTSVAGPISTTTSQNYTASVWPNPDKDHFDLIPLNIGVQRVATNASLKGNFINIGYWSPDYDQSSSSSGTLSATKNTFTIDSKFHRFTPRVTYTCRNVYTKQLVLN